jgi:hypothetical protein
MHSQFKSAAILHLLDKALYNNVLVINGWQVVNAIIACHSISTVHIANSDLISGDRVIDAKFDLIIAFSPNFKTLEYINECNKKSKIEVLIVHCAFWTYGWRDVSQYRELVGVSGDHNSNYIRYGETMKYLSSSKSSVYFPLPNIIEPEMILSKGGFSNYRRYWSWSQLPAERSFISFFGEFVFIKILKSAFLSPFSVVKLN